MTPPTTFCSLNLNCSRCFVLCISLSAFYDKRIRAVFCCYIYFLFTPRFFLAFIHDIKRESSGVDVSSSIMHVQHEKILTEHRKQNSWSKWRIGEGWMIGFTCPCDPIVRTGGSELDDRSGCHSVICTLLIHILSTFCKNKEQNMFWVCTIWQNTIFHPNVQF